MTPITPPKNTEGISSKAYEQTSNFASSIIRITRRIHELGQYILGKLSHIFEWQKNRWSQIQQGLHEWTSSFYTEKLKKRRLQQDPETLPLDVELSVSLFSNPIKISKNISLEIQKQLQSLSHPFHTCNKKARVITTYITAKEPPLSSLSSFFSESFLELTYRLRNFPNIIGKLATLERAEENISKLTQAYLRNDWETISQIPDFSYYALEAVREQKLTQSQFATIQLYWATIQRYGKENVECISDPYKIYEILITTGKSINKDDGNTFCMLSEAQAKQILGNLKPHECQLFLPKKIRSSKGILGEVMI